MFVTIPVGIRYLLLTGVIGIMSVSVNGWLTNSWSQSLVFTAIFIILPLPFYMTIPESYRWHFSRGAISQGRDTLRSFCEKSGYPYDDTIVDKILAQEDALHKKLKKSSQNELRYPAFLKTIGKLVVAWNAVCMVYFGILMGDLPGGLLKGNLLLGLASFVVGPLTNILMASKYAFRRPIISTLFTFAGLGCIAIAYLDIYHKRYVSNIYN